MAGALYGVSVGPGDPELMTRLAERRIREADVIAVPGKTAETSAAYRIAVQAVPEIAEKEVLALGLPMTDNPEMWKQTHRAAAAELERRAQQGRRIACLVLGDVTLYSSFGYLQRVLQEEGFAAELIPGVPAFCAAAARLGVFLAEGREPLTVLPGTVPDPETPGTVVVMKAAGHIPEIRAAFAGSGRAVCGAERAGMPGERLFASPEELPEEAGYFTTIIIR